MAGRMGTRRGRVDGALLRLLAPILLLGLLVRYPGGLSAPLLEGAAGKQTHTAMVARNLARGRSSWLRPMVDDVGTPGYFVKELPLVPGLAAALARTTGAPIDAIGRAIGIASWLAGALLLTAIVHRDGPPLRAALAAAWFVLAPAAIAYSRAFMTDPSMVAASLAALLLARRWREHPSRGRAVATGAATALALLLKPHAILWLAPALAVAITADDAGVDAGVDGATRAGDDPTRRSRAALFASLAAGAALAAAWYAHAAAIHRAYPVPGAMVASGWVDPSLWARPALWARIARQLVEIVFTPAGLALACVALAPGRERFGPSERALLAWGAGVVVQSALLGTRMFDDAARGTEYYQLPAVATAALLVARGAERIAAFARGPRAVGAERIGAAIAAALVLAAGLSGFPATRAIETPPSAYADLPARCARVRELVRPDEALLVVADRPGIVHWECDRRGTTFTPATAMGAASAETRVAAAPDALWRTLESVDRVFLPFPEIVPASMREWLDREWRRVPDETVVLYAKRPPGAGLRP